MNKFHNLTISGGGDYPGPNCELCVCQGAYYNQKIDVGLCCKHFNNVFYDKHSNNDWEVL